MARKLVSAERYALLAMDYSIRIEFQARGSPHAHCVIWVKDAPKYGVGSDVEVCEFIGQYITCAIPQRAN